MIEGACHCGNIRWCLAAEPETLTDCNCSFCRRTQALWAYAGRQDVTITVGPAGRVHYSHGDRTLAFVSCAGCGGTTHWQGLGPTNEQVAVNMRMATDAAAITRFRIRHFDGAESWTYAD